MLIGTLQFDVQWENPYENIALISRHLAEAPDMDLLILPEMFNSGFSMNARRIAEPMNGPTVKAMRSWSAVYNMGTCGSLAIQENGYFYNRFIFVDPDGNLRYYDKKQLFSLAGEQEAYKSGAEHKVFSFRGVRVCPQICYDLRFPEWQRAALPYDLLIFVASWPETRRMAWKTLLQARAIENQCFVIGVNRIGADQNNLKYAGDSMVIDPEGKVMYDADDRNELLVHNVDFSSAQNFRLKFPFLDDRLRITFD